MRYFHGGKPGLKPGELLVPQPANEPGWHRDDCEWCKSGADNSAHPESIYITTEKEYARYYASRFGKGDLYVVEPVGEIVGSTEDSGLPVWRCDSARVVSVYDRCVILTRTQRRRVFKMLPGPAWYTFEMMERDAYQMVRSGTAGQTPSS